VNVSEDEKVSEARQNIENDENIEDVSNKWEAGQRNKYAYKATEEQWKQTMWCEHSCSMDAKQW
jgi:hypothetical protein